MSGGVEPSRCTPQERETISRELSRGRSTRVVLGNCSGGTIARSHTRSSVMGVPPITGLLLLRSVIIVQGATEGGEGAPPPNPSTAL
jgi:hypothetical protein